MTKVSKLLGLLLIPVLVGIFSYKTASAFFNDTETSSGNLFAAAATFPSSLPSASPSSKPSSNPNPCANNHGLIFDNSFSKNIIDITCINATSSAQINDANVNNTVIIDSTTGNNNTGNTNNGSNTTTTGNSTIDVNISTSTNTNH